MMVITWASSLGIIRFFDHKRQDEIGIIELNNDEKVQCDSKINDFA